MRHTLLLYFFLCTYGFARAEVSAPILALPSPTEAVQPCLRVLTDVPENTGFDSVRNIPVNEYSVFQDVIPQLKRNKSYWLRLQVRNTEAETKTYYLIAGITQEIDLYVSGTDGTYTKKSYGYSVPDNRKEYSELVSEVIGVRLLPKEEKTLYFRVKSELNLKPSPLFKLKEQGEYRQFLMTFNFKQGLFHGLLWMMVIYIFFMYLNIRDRAYLYYMLYASTFSLSIFILIGYPRHYLFNDTIFHVLNSELSLQISSLFLFLLLRKVLNVKDISAQWSKFCRIALWVTGAGIFITGIFFFVDFYLYNLSSQISTLCSLLFYLTILIGLFRYQNSVTIYYFIGNLSLTIGSFIITIALLFFHKPFLDYFPVFQLTAAIEAIFFAMGLSKRFQETERQKREAQSEYIRELKEKEALQMQINEDLEELVGERTMEILQSKQEIEHQRSALALKHILLEESTRIVTENLEYASFMQKALLDDFLPLKNIFSDAFLIYKPSSFVSGDFYMYFELQDGKYIIIAADCTGHGVPGAMLTFIAQGFLQDLVQRKKIYCPSELLHQLENKICNRLCNISSGKSLHEGLDASVVYVDTFLRRIEFAGARMPLFIIQDGQVRRIKGSPHGIGGGASERTRSQIFSKHSIGYRTGDSLYLMTDGYSDQLNCSRQKFLVSRLLGLLDINKDRSMSEQKAVLESQHASWKSIQSQTDDILILGLKL